MLYLDYEDFRMDYLENERFYQRLLDEKEKLWMRTQPKASKIGSDKIVSGYQDNCMDEYLISMEQKRLEQKLAEYKSILDAKAELMERKRQDLLDSRYVEDRVYCMRYFDGYKVPVIARKVHFSASTVYRILKQIKKNLNYE